MGDVVAYVNLLRHDRISNFGLRTSNLMGDAASFVAFHKIFRATLLKKVDSSVMADGECRLVKRDTSKASVKRTARRNGPECGIISLPISDR